jgi:hypothetical protein
MSARIPVAVGALCLAAAPAARAAGSTSGASGPPPTRVEVPVESRADAPSSTPDWPAVGGGLTLFGLGYGIALYVGAQQGFQRGGAWLGAPVVGPWAALADHVDSNEWGIAGDGVLQLGGVLIATAGFVYPKRTLGPAQARIGPYLTASTKADRRRGWSLGVRGTF